MRFPLVMVYEPTPVGAKPMTRLPLAPATMWSPPVWVKVPAPLKPTDSPLAPTALLKTVSVPPESV